MLRTAGDLRALIAATKKVKRAVVLGGSFIGLEAAASLRARGLEVEVVVPDALPLLKVLGPEVAQVVRSLHEQHGVRFHLGRRAVGLFEKGVKLDDGSAVEGDLVVAGTGVKPDLSLAEDAGLKTDQGVVVDATLRTSDASVWAAGDLARFPGKHGASWRIEHWALAQNQGRAAARNMLGLHTPFTTAPFFWSQHYELTIGYVGHAESWDQVEVQGDLSKPDAEVRFLEGGRLRAVITLNRDRASMEAHEAMNAEP